MKKLLNIIEIINGEYVLNTDLLKSTLTLANNCNNIALISIVGPKSHGKTFFIKCLINYMNSESKDQWPHSYDALIQMENRLQSYDNIITPVIKITSSPFIITDEIEDEILKTAVFLMDSDFVFDNEMSSQQVQDIIELFLLTSSTVIYNHKQSLPEKEFFKLETISSRISYINNSLDSLKNIVFLIRDWSPETRNNEFGFGLLEGSKYIKNFIQNTKLNKSYHDLNCFLMSTPELDTQTEDIKLYKLNKQFLLDLKNLIDFKIFNTEEMLKKKRPNTNEYIKSNELFVLFKNCVQKLNGDIDENMLVKDPSIGKVNSVNDDRLRDEIKLSENETDLKMNSYNSVSATLLSKTSKSYLNNSIGVTNNSIFETETSSQESIEENNANGTEKPNYSNIDLIELTYDTESDSIVCLSSDSSEEKFDDFRDDESFLNSDTIVSQTEEDLISDEKSDNTLSLEKQNINNTCSLKKEEVKESEKTSTFEYQSLTTFSKSLHQDLRGTNSYDYESHDNTENNNKISESFVYKNKDNETEIKNQFKNLVNKLILEYNTNMEIKLKDQVLDLDMDLTETHIIIKEKILETFEKNFNDMEPSLMVRNYKAKYCIELNNKMEEAIKKHKSKAKLKLKEALKVLKEISVLYEIDLKSSIIDQMKGDSHTLDFNQIQIMCKEKAFNIFQEETAKGNIETKFLSKFNEEINQINCNFETIWNNYRAENRFKNLFNELILEYNTIMEVKLEDQILNLDRDLTETHEISKRKILETFEKNFNDIEPSLIVRDYKARCYLELNDSMEEAITTYKSIVEVKLKEAIKVLKEKLVLYEMKLKSSIIDKLEGKKLNPIEINSGLSDEDLRKEKQKLDSPRNIIREEIKLNEEKLCLGEAISELRNYCSNVMSEVKNNLKLRPMIKKQILLEIEKTLSFLSGEHLVLNDIIAQKQMLDKTLEGYKFEVKE